MSSPSTGQRRLAQAAWVVPLLLVVLSVDQLKVAHDLRTTLRSGEAAVAEVLEFDKVDRPDVTYGYVSLRVRLSDGSVLSREKLSLPYTLLALVEDRDSLEVAVLPGGSQEIIIVDVAATQWKIAAIQSAIGLVAVLLSFVAAVAWNRSLLGQRRRVEDALSSTSTT